MSASRSWTSFGVIGVLAIVVQASLMPASRAQPATAASPIRLAIVAEDKSLAPALDLLTAELSTNSQLALLERAQIDKVLAEQALSAATGRDALKLGQLLGADGVLALETNSVDGRALLSARLIAVKPGVVLGIVKAPLPLEDPLPWSRIVSQQFAPLFPKLTVLVKNAIPISIVNLRSALRSREAQELERQLTLLTIERLSRERELFVLERRRMESLSAEKELKGMEESAFWNGSYLLEGIVDRDGFSKENLTVSARLVPPGGGAPVNIEINGSRSNLSEAIERLAAKVRACLNLDGRNVSWNPTDEAKQFCDEAQWAVKWKMIREAQMASESAWALGKRDLECALVRVKAYLAEVHPYDGNVLKGIRHRGEARAIILTMMQNRKVERERSAVPPTGNKVERASADNMPDAQGIDRAVHALGLYDDFSRTLPSDEPRTGSPWYLLGLDALEAATGVLQDFYAVPESQRAVSDKLAELRARTRAIAAWICQSPSVRATYWVGDRVATYSELYDTIQWGKNIFRFKVESGCYWQDKPEDCIALYRELMSSPVFCYLHARLWDRQLGNPRLSAWSREDQGRVPAIWRNFVQELNTSTNLLLRMEAKAIELADATDSREADAAFDALFALIFANHDAIVTNNVELLYEEWGLRALVNKIGPESQRRFYSEYRPRLEAMNQEYRNKCEERAAEKESLARFERQKQFLTNDTPYDFVRLVETLRPGRMTAAHAAELLPLLGRYRTNLVAQAANKTGAEKGHIQSGVRFVEFAESELTRILNPPPRARNKDAANDASRGSGLAAQPVAPTNLPGPRSEPVLTNLLPVAQFFRIPGEPLPSQARLGLTIFTHRWREGKMWLGVAYHDLRSDDDRALAAAWSPQNNGWDIYPGPAGRVARDFELFNGALYWISGQVTNTSNRGLAISRDLRKYDFKTGQWETLRFPKLEFDHLFVVNGHLYAASDESILEIPGDGQGVRILASCRRRPAASVLDALESLKSPVLFPGPEQSLRAMAGQGIYSWGGQDWVKILEFPFPLRATPVGDGVILQSSYENYHRLWLLPREQTNTELCLKESSPGPALQSTEPGQGPSPAWKGTDNLSLTGGAVEVSGTNLYVFVAYSREAMSSTEHFTLEEKNGRHANLVFLDHGFTNPFVVPLKFDLARSPFTDRRPVVPPAGFMDFQQPWWITLTPQSLVIGRANIAGLWAIPRSELDAAVEREMQPEREKKLQLAAAAAERRNAVVAKYDRNQDGTLDPQEKGEALADPAFIALELSAIDANHDGRLDAAELGYFDVNRNGILDPNEGAGIETTQRLLAAKLLETFDANHDGQLDRIEFARVLPNRQRVDSGPGGDFLSFDMNHNDKLDARELEFFLKQQTWRELRATTPPTAVSNLDRTGRQPTFKQQVEVYWKHASTGIGVSQ